MGYLANCSSVDEIHNTVYCAAMTVLELANINGKKSAGERENRIPPWERRLKRKVEDLRRQVALLTNLLNPQIQSSERVKRKVKQIVKSLKMKKSISNAGEMREVLEILKQKLGAYATRIKRYHERTRTFRDNNLFERNPKVFYRSLEESNISVTSPPSPQQFHGYWHQLWGEEVNHVSNASWIQQIRETLVNVPEMPAVDFSPQDIKHTVTAMANWTAPGIDKIQAFWWKYFTSTHQPLAAQFAKITSDPSAAPNFLTQGITYMLPKSENTSDPKNYRPITCLPVVYKLYTGILSKKISSHLTANNLLAVEQNGCRAGAKGSKELLVIDSIITAQAKTKRRNISMGWIDYRKAFDSVPHSWLIEVLRLYKINIIIINALEQLMNRWKTTISLKAQSKTIQTSPIALKRGIFQGDSLSPLWFCLALNPLSSLLNASNYGYVIDTRTKQKVNHLFYVDDLKVYSASAQQLHSILEIVKNFSDSIRMGLGIEKCAVLNVKAGQVSEGDIRLMDGTEIQHLVGEQKYKYLGMIQTFRNDDKHIKSSAEKELFKRLNAVLKTKLYSRAKFTAINAWAMPKIMYTFGVVKWSDTDLDALDRRVRTLLTKYRAHHPKSSTCRLYLPRNKGGRGLLSLKTACKNEIFNLKKYFSRSETAICRAVRKADSKGSPLNLHEPLPEQTPKFTAELLNTWKGKELHGRFYSSLNSETVNQQLSLEYLKRGYLAVETEGSILAIQDQVVATRSYRKHICHLSVDSELCRLCHSTTESIQHLISGCSYLASRDYLTRHNHVAKIFHQALCQQNGITTSSQPFFKYTPQTVEENEDAKILWDMPIQTDRLTLHNRPDIVVLYKAEKRALLIDITCPLDDNIHKSHVEKITKYMDLAHEIKELWHLDKVQIIPIVISANGLIHKDLPSYVAQLKLSDAVLVESQKAVVLETARIIRRVVTEKVLV